jgi:sugar phosphate isomerase/epimerase
MRNPLALHTWTLDTTPLPRVLAIARETGWRAVELRRLDFARAAERGQEAEAVLDLVRSSGLATACVGVALGWMWAEGDERAKLLRVFDESCRWAKALGCRTVMSPVDRGRGEVARAVASVAEVGDIAARHGVRLALEFNSQCEQLNTLSSVRDLLDKAAHTHVGLLLDSYHLGRSGARPEDLDDVPGGDIAYVQFSDVPRSGLVPGQALDRLPPGQGSVPFAAFFAALERRGYAGYCSYEAPNPAAWARDPASVAREALEATLAVAP